MPESGAAVVEFQPSADAASLAKRTLEPHPHRNRLVPRTAAVTTQRAVSEAPKQEIVQ